MSDSKVHVTLYAKGPPCPGTIKAVAKSWTGVGAWSDSDNRLIIDQGPDSPLVEITWREVDRAELRAPTGSGGWVPGDWCAGDTPPGYLDLTPEPNDPTDRERRAWKAFQDMRVAAAVNIGAERMLEALAKGDRLGPLKISKETCRMIDAIRAVPPPWVTGKAATSDEGGRDE